MPGQILRTTHINRLSLANRANVIPFTGLGINKVKLYTDWDIDLNIETIDLSGIQEPDCIENQQSYDQCIISLFLQNGNNSGFSDLILCDATCWSSKLQLIPLKVIEEYFDTIMSPTAISKCAKSCHYIQMVFDQTTNRKLLKMILYYSYPQLPQFKKLIRSNQDHLKILHQSSQVKSMFQGAQKM
jgi:hypothetical protein